MYAIRSYYAESSRIYIIQGKFVSIASLEDVPERIVTSASATARVFRVDTDEVALFRLKDGTVLNFLWPEKLQKVGFIPLNSHDSLAARTIREKRAYLNNA